MSLHPSIPIQTAQAGEQDALRLALGEVRQLLLMYYPADLIDAMQADQIVTGQWYGRVKGFHRPDDFWHLVRDFRLYLLSADKRSQTSDQLAYYFSGFMPSYGAATTFVGMLYDKANWADLEAFMHHLAYGNARQYVEGFDWGGGKAKAEAEIKAWVAILDAQCDKLDRHELAAEPVLLAQAMPQPNWPITDVPANDPHYPKPRPKLRVVPKPPVSPSPQPAPLPRAWSPWLILLLPLMLTGDTPVSDEFRAEDYVPEEDVEADRVNNECQPQTEKNKRNGDVCEKDGYIIMQAHLNYKALAPQPRGKGLDGLFEKMPGMSDRPDPFPNKVWKPRGGLLYFVPKGKTPPHPDYDFLTKQRRTYPKFVVFEAKHIAKTFDATDEDGIAKEARNRLKNTCDGTQLGTRWSDKRIEPALKKNGKNSPADVDKKAREIRRAGFARWIFVCLPAPLDQAKLITLGSAIEKLYIIIDVGGSGMDLDSQAPKQRKKRTPAGGNGY